VDAFRLDLVTVGTSAIITVSSDLDLATAETLTELANSTLLDPKTRTLLLDLHQVTFLDSAGSARSSISISARKLKASSSECGPRHPVCSS
jgi:anti-anti-sigma factor